MEFIKVDTEAEKTEVNTPFTYSELAEAGEKMVIKPPELKKELTEEEIKSKPHYKVYYNLNNRIVSLEELFPETSASNEEERNYTLIARYFYETNNKIARKEYYKQKNGLDILYRVDYYENNVLVSKDNLEYTPAFYYSHIYFRDKNTNEIYKEEIYSQKSEFAPVLLEFRIFYNKQQGSVLVESFDDLGSFVNKKHFDYYEFSAIYTEIFFDKRTKVNKYFRRYYNNDLLEKEEIYDNDMNLKYYYLFYYNDKREQIKYEYYDENDFLLKVVEKAKNGFWLPTYVGE